MLASRYRSYPVGNIGWNHFSNFPGQFQPEEVDGIKRLKLSFSRGQGEVTTRSCRFLNTTATQHCIYEDIMATELISKAYLLHKSLYLKFKLIYERRYFFLSVCPLWQEDGPVIYLCDCFWVLPKQSLSGPSPVELVAIFSLSHMRLPQPWGPGPILFAICTSKFRKMFKKRIQWQVEECSLALLCS
jgi:hypothetical protein